MSFLTSLFKRGQAPIQTVAEEVAPEGGRPFKSIAQDEKWTDFGGKLCQQGIMGTVTHPHLYILWKTSEMAERVAKFRPTATESFLAEQPEVMTFPDGSGAVGFRLKSERDFVKFVDVLLSGKDYGEQAVFQSVLAAMLPERDRAKFAGLFGASEGMTMGNVFMLG
jgi:hypothetical protein